MSSRREAALASLVVIDSPNKIPQLSFIMDLKLLPRHQRGVAVLVLLTEGVGVDGRGDTTRAVPFRIMSMALLMKLFDPWSIRSRCENRVATSRSKVLGEASKTLNAGELIRFTIDVSVDFLPLKGVLALPRPGLIPRPVGEVEPHFAIPGAVLKGVIFQVHPAF